MFKRKTIQKGTPTTFSFIYVVCSLLFLGSQVDCVDIMEPAPFYEASFSLACTKVLGRMVGTRLRSSTYEGE